MNDLLAQVFSYFHGIWAYRWSALIITWVVSILGWTGVYFLPDQYTSSAIIRIETQSAMQPLLEGLVVDTKIDKGLGAISSRLFNSGNMEDIVNATDLRSKATSEEAMERITYDVASKLSLESLTDEGSSKKKNKDTKAVYMLSFEGRSPLLVYQIATAALDTLVKGTLESARTDTSSAQEFLDIQIAEYEERLNAAEQRVAEFTRENTGLMPGESGGYYDRLKRAQEAMEETRANLKLVENRLANMRKQLSGEAPISGSGDQVEKLRNYRAQLQELLTQFTESHPDVQTVRANISDLLSSQSGAPVYIEKGSSAELNPAYQDLKSNIGAAKSEANALRAKLAEQTLKVKTLKSSVSHIPEVEAQLARLNRDYDIMNNRYLKLVERKELALLADAVGQSGKNVDVRIISPPEMAEEPSGPDRILFISLVFAAAIAAGIAWGAIKFALQPTFIYVRQLDDQIGLPILGTVGLFLTAKHKRKRKAQMFSFLLVFLVLVILYGYNIYTLLDISIDDILLQFKSSDI
jgi:polysaccharide chain length determinant protein (PEP-CTERM system associated)